MARFTQPTPYVRQPLSLITNGNPAWVYRELSSIETAIRTTQGLTPQPATIEPANPSDGMLRLARQPWQPLKDRLGIILDCWVFYDGKAGIWRHLGENPTDTNT